MKLQRSLSISEAAALFNWCQVLATQISDGSWKLNTQKEQTPCCCEQQNFLKQSIFNCFRLVGVDQNDFPFACCFSGRKEKLAFPNVFFSLVRIGVYSIGKQIQSRFLGLPVFFDDTFQNSFCFHVVF